MECILAPRISFREAGKTTCLIPNQLKKGLEAIKYLDYFA